MTATARRPWISRRIESMLLAAGAGPVHAGGVSCERACRCVTAFTRSRPTTAAPFSGFAQVRCPTMGRMGYFTDHARARWAVPGTALAVVAGAALVAGRGAEAAGSLPPRSPEQLLVDLQQAHLTGLSGTVVQTADLGLPELP